MPKYKNIRIKKKGGGTRTQRVQVLASGKYKFVKNKTRGRTTRKRASPKRRKSPARKRTYTKRRVRRVARRRKKGGSRGKTIKIGTALTIGTVALPMVAPIIDEAMSGGTNYAGAAQQGLSNGAAAIPAALSVAAMTYIARYFVKGTIPVGRGLRIGF